MRAQSRYEGSSHLARPAAERGRLALPLSLLLVGVGYVLLVTGPLLSARLASLLSGGLTSSTATLPAVAAAGVALLGASAMVLVLARLVRDVESHPYATIAPVLAVFSAFLTTSARATLPLEGWASEHLGLFVLTLALLGGALVAREQRAGRLFGWLLALLPFTGLALVLAWSVPGDPLVVLAQDPALQAYLSLLGSSALALALAGWLARTLAASGGAREVGALRERDRHDTPVLLPMPEPARFGEPILRLATATRQLPHGQARAQAHTPAPHASAARAPQRPRDWAEPRWSRQPAPSPGLGQPRRPRVASGERLRAPASAPARAPTRDPRGPSLAVALDPAFDEQAAIELMRPRGSRHILWFLCAVLGVGTPVAGYVLSRPPHNARLPVEVREARTAPAVAAPVASPGPSLAVTTEPLETELAVPSAPAAVAPDAAGNRAPGSTLGAATAQPDAQAAARERRATRRQARAERRARAVMRAQTHDAEQGAVAVGERRGGGDREPTRARSRAAREPQTPAEPQPPTRKRVDSAAVLDESTPPRAAVAGSQNERDLDLDELVHKALKSSNGVRAADDPLLGL